MRTRSPEPGGIQKIFLINTFKWSATVSYSGVARYGTIDVSKWFASKTQGFNQDDPFEKLLDELVTAEAWLRQVPRPYNRHSFSIGAFIGSVPKFVLISNFERPLGIPDPVASAALNVHEVHPTKPRLYVAGEKSAVSRATRRRLERLAEAEPDDKHVYNALAAVNRSVANFCPSVSQSCYTSHLRLTGEGGGEFHHFANEANIPVQPMVMPGFAEEAIRKLVDSHFGPGRGRIVGLSTMRMASTEEDHQVQLREKPGDPHVHNNYGAFLKDKRGDNVGAEREYRMALELDPNHANALGNLANLLAERNENESADRLYTESLSANPGQENVTYNYSRFLLRLDKKERADSILEAGVAKNPKSARLLALRAERHLVEGRFSDSIADYVSARDNRGDQKQIEAGIAFALHLKGAPIDECIDAYRTAIALNPDHAPLRLNLSQLLFIRGFCQEANKLLRSSLYSNLDESARLEGQFYRLAHTSDSASEILRECEILLEAGGRLAWDVSKNIEEATRSDLNKAEQLREVARILEGEEDASKLESRIRLFRGE